MKKAIVTPYKTMHNKAFYISALALLVCSCTVRQNNLISNASCIRNLYLENKKEYDSWEMIFTNNYPSFEVYDAGSVCTLENNFYVVTYSYWNTGDGKQIVILFDEQKEIIESADFKCASWGDLTTPFIESVQENKVSILCRTADMDLTSEQEFLLDLSNFHITEIIDKKIKIRRSSYTNL